MKLTYIPWLIKKSHNSCLWPTEENVFYEIRYIFPWPFIEIGDFSPQPTAEILNFFQQPLEKKWYWFLKSLTKFTNRYKEIKSPVSSKFFFLNVRRRIACLGKYWSGGNDKLHFSLLWIFLFCTQFTQSCTFLQTLPHSPKKFFLNNPSASQNENSGCIYFQKNYCLVFNIHQDGFKIRKS